MTSIRDGFALIVCFALLVSGCSDGDRGGESGRAAATPTASDEPADLPDGMAWVETGLGLRFAAPARHHTITGDAVYVEPNTAVVEAFAARFHFAASFVRAGLSHTDVLVVGGPERSIWVTRGEDEVPSEAELTAEQPYHGTWAHIEAFDSPLGASTIAYYPYRIHGKWSFTASLYLPLDEGTAFMFVVSPRYDELTALVAEMIPTLGQVDVSR